MADLREITVVDKTGATGRVLGELDAQDETMQDAHLVVVEFGGARYQLPRDTLVPQGNDSFLLPLSLTELAVARQVIPVVHEEVDIGKRTVSEQVRVHTVVRERPEEVNVELTDIEVSVEHVPIGKVLSGKAEIRTEGDVTIIPIVEERVVVTKQLFLKEEVRITRKRVAKTHTETVTLREEEVQLSRTPAQAADDFANDKAISEGGDGYVTPSKE